jgi:hypothetical protein
MSEPRGALEQAPGSRATARQREGAGPMAHLREGVGPLTFTRLKWTSFAHSCVYTALLVCAFAAGKPQPLTFVLGLTHGLLWICMSLACIAAARLRVVSLKLAVAVAVLGGIGPFFGSLQFVREQRQRAGSKTSGPRDVTAQVSQPPR